MVLQHIPPHRGPHRPRVRWIMRVVVVLALVSPVAIHAQGGQAPFALTLGELYRRLEQSSPRLLAARASVRAAQARIAPARRLPDPQLQLGLMNRNLPGLGLQDPLGMNTLQLMQMIPTAGKLGLAAEVAEAQTAATDARAGDLVWTLRSEAAMAFYDLYQADASLGVSETSRRLLEEIAQSATTQYASGQGTQADALRARVEVARMAEEVIRMRAMRETMVARINTLLDRPPETPIPSLALPPPPASLPSADSLEGIALTGRPMLRAGAADVRAAERASVLARRDIWPDLQVGLQYGQRPMSGGTERMMSFMFGVSLPIWAGSRQLKMREETEAMRQEAAAELTAMQAATRGRLAELEAEFRRTLALSRMYRDTIIPQADAAASSALSAYRLGTVEFMPLLEARMSANQYRLELIRLTAEEGKAVAEMEMLLGQPLVDPDTAVGANGEDR